MSVWAVVSYFIQDCAMPVNQGWLGGQGPGAFDEEEEEEEKEYPIPFTKRARTFMFLDHFFEDVDPCGYDDDDDDDDMDD